MLSHYRLRKQMQLVINKRSCPTNANSGKKCVLREIHHRIRNNTQLILSLISIARRTTAEEAVRTELEFLSLRLSVIALVQQRGYDRHCTPHIDFPRLLGDILGDIRHYIGDVSFLSNVTFDIYPVHLSIDQSSYCGLLFLELCLASCVDRIGGHSTAALTFTVRQKTPGIISYISYKETRTECHEFILPEFSQLLVTHLAQQLRLIPTWQQEKSERTLILEKRQIL